MTKLFLVSTALLAGSASGAFANGDHSGSLFHTLSHMLSEPDHLAMLSASALAAYTIYRFSRRSI